MRPLALDLCCGMGGWTHGLVAAGWDVIGFDVTDWGYEAATGQTLIIGDVREVDVIPGDGIYFGKLCAVSLKGRIDADSMSIANKAVNWLPWQLKNIEAGTDPNTGPYAPVSHLRP